jgi:ArsR family transcriptional regulator, arsenate/arsenite/antimonite-responsive transcriptional repressor
VDDIGEVSRLLRALAVEMRLRILQLVAQRALCVGALAVQLGITQGAVSQHLRILRDAGLVRAARRGMFIHYEADPEALQLCQTALRGILTPAPTPRTRTRQHRGGSSCPRQNKPVGSRKS